MDDATRYEALASRDARFDGLFFVGVKTTGIYCRPVCPARLPAAKNCVFFENAARAELAGFRACFRCRPELAPGASSVDAPSTIATRAAARIRGGALDRASIDELASELGITARHLRRAMTDELGVTPVQLAQSQRIGLAKRLLQDTALPMASVASAAGFGSVRRFNAAFKDRFDMPPSDVRRGPERDGVFSAELAFRPPLQWEKLLEFMAGRAVPGVESASDLVYRRNVRLGEVLGTVEVRRTSEARLTADLSVSLAPHVADVITRLRCTFDLDARPDLIAEHLTRDTLLAGVVARLPGLRAPGAFDGFELAVRIILGQQVSVAGATTTSGRFAEAFGKRDEQGRLYFPTRAEVAALDPEAVHRVGMPRRRSQTIVDVANSAARLEPSADPREEVEHLLAVRGIGPWTANYIVMRALRFPDAYPEGDLVLDRKGGTVERAEQWRPWRSYAAMYLWNREDDE